MSKASTPNTSIYACTLLPMGLKLKLEDKTDNRSYLQPRCKHHESCMEIFKHHCCALPFLDYLLFLKTFFKALFTTNFYIKYKNNGRKTLTPGYTGGLKQMIKLPVHKLSRCALMAVHVWALSQKYRNCNVILHPSLSVQYKLCGITWNLSWTRCVYVGGCHSSARTQQLAKL